MSKFLAWWADFLRSAARSVYDLKAYREFRLKRPAEAVGYLSVLVSIFWLAPLMVTFFMGVRSALDAFNRDFRKNVPAGTVFEMKKGVLTDNLQSPIVVSRGGLTFIVNTATSTLTLSASESGIVVGRDSILQKEGDSVDAFPFKSAPDFRAAKEDIDSWVNSNAPWMVFVLAVVTLAAAALALILQYSASAALYGLLLWAAYRLARKPIRFAEGFVVAAYASALPIVLKSVFYWAGVDVGYLPTAAYFILLGFIVYDSRSDAVPAATRPPGTEKGAGDAGKRDEGAGGPGAQAR